MLHFVQAAQADKQGPLTTAKMPALASKIYEGCDAKDGLKDGVIDDPRKCDFKPTRDLARCAADDKSDCFTAPQIATLETIYSDVMAGGQRVFPGWAPGAEIAGPNGASGWMGWFFGSNNQPSAQFAFGETFFRYLAPPRPNPTLDLLTVDPDRDAPRLDTIHQILDATDTDLTRFQQRGGKLLMY